MHIPDGVLDPGVLAVAGAASVGAVAWSAVAVRRGVARGRAPRWGLAAAGASAVTVAHLADVPLYGGHTAHLIGGTLLAVAVGPALAVLTMTGVLALEAALLGDGGMAALGVNVLVMGVVGVLVGYGVYRGVVLAVGRLRGSPSGASEVPPGVAAVAAAAGAWVSVTASALTLATVEVAGGAAASVASALLPQHAAWGLLEALVTGGAVAVALAWGGQVARLRSAPRTPHAVQACDGEVPALA